MSDFETNYGYEEGTFTDEEITSSKKKGKKNKKKQKRDSKFVVGIVAIAVALIIWMCLVVVQDRIVNDAVKAPVVVAIMEVPEGIELTRENMSQYFGVEQRDVEQIPDSVTTYSSGTPLVGKVTDRVIHAKELVTDECFYEVNFYDEVENGVEIAIDLSALGRSVAGTLQAGDFVNIRSVIQMEKETIMEVPEELKEEYPGGLLEITPVESEDVVEEEKEPVGNVISYNQDGEVIESGDVNLENFDLTYGVTGDYVVQNVADNVRVTKVFNSGGESMETVEANGGKMVATIIKVVVPKETATLIWLALTEGNLYVEKVLELESAPLLGEIVEGEEQAVEAAPQN